MECVKGGERVWGKERRMARGESIPPTPGHTIVVVAVAVDSHTVYEYDTVVVVSTVKAQASVWPQ